MIKVLLDTNFLMIPYIHKIDVFQEIERLIPGAHELITPSSVLEELQKLRDSGGRDGVAAQVALQLLKEKDVKKIQSQDRADEFLINYATANKPDVVVCTNDRELKKRLKPQGTPLVYLRGKNRLELSGNVI